MLKWETFTVADGSETVHARLRVMTWAYRNKGQLKGLEVVDMTTLVRSHACGTLK